MLAPSVFNFFSPFYTRPGKLAAAGMVAPEFQITNEIQSIGTANFFYNLVREEGSGYGDDQVKLNLDAAFALAADAAKLTDFLDSKLTYGQLSTNTRQIVIESVAAIPLTGGERAKQIRVRTALTLLALSPDFVIQK